jgi:hypothetical protein
MGTLPRSLRYRLIRGCDQALLAGNGARIVHDLRLRFSGGALVNK